MKKLFIVLTCSLCLFASSAFAALSAPEGTHTLPTNGAYLSSAQVLPNGHLLLAGSKGFLVEVSPVGRTLYRYPGSSGDDATLGLSGKLPEDTIVFTRTNYIDGEPHTERGTFHSAGTDAPVTVSQPLGEFTLPPELKADAWQAKLFFGEHGIVSVLSGGEDYRVPTHIFVDTDMRHVFTTEVTKSEDLMVQNAVQTTGGIVVLGAEDPFFNRTLVAYKLDWTGKLLWYNALPDDVDIAHNMLAMPDGGVVITGRTLTDATVLRLNTDGELLWQRGYADVQVGLNPFGITRLGEDIVIGFDVDSRYAQARVLHIRSDDGAVLGSETIAGNSENAFLTVYLDSDVRGGTCLYGLHIPRHDKPADAEAFYLKLSPETFGQ